MKKLIFLLAALTLCLFSGCAGPAASVSELAFADPPGIYQARFGLKLLVPDGAEVRYTIDGSVPTADSALYDPESGIPISYRGGGGNDPSSVNVIRAVCFDADGQTDGNVLTGTYILADSPEVRYSTMIVSLVTDPDGLYGYENGILVPGKINADFKLHRPAYWTNDSLEDANYFQSGIDWERPTHAEFFLPDGTCVLSQDIGIRVSGGWNRRNSHKSLRLFARYLYDDANVMDFDAYPGLLSVTGTEVGAHKTLILRTGSNNSGNTIIQTAFLMNLADGLGIDTMHYRPVCVYLDGKYYGYMAMLEDYGTTYFEMNYGVPAEEVTCINGAGIISGGRAWQLDCGPQSDLKEFNRMLNYITSLDMKNAKYYGRACEMLDIDSFIRYMCFEGYIANSDWPQNNTRVWRCNSAVGDNGYDPDAPYGFDGRWRFLLKDLDLAAGYSSDKTTDSVFLRLNSDDGGLRLNAIFKSLFQNPDFKNRVYCFLCDLLNSTMEVDSVMAKLGETAASASLEMRYYLSSYSVGGGNLEKWYDHLRTPMKFFIQRYDVVKNELPKKYDSVWGTLRVNISGEGTVKLSTLSLTESDTLEYLVGLKLPLSFEAADGWKLASVKLSCAGDPESGSFMMGAKSVTLDVSFTEDENAPGVRSGLLFNEIRYAHPRSDLSSDLIELANSTGSALYLKGYRLIKESTREDGTHDKDTFDLPAITVPDGGYLVVHCDRSGASPMTDGCHAPFGIAAGDTLTLIGRMGNTLDAVTLPVCGNYAALARDEAAPGEESVWVTEARFTFGEPNVTASGYRLADVLDERARGVFLWKGRLVTDFAKPDGKGGYYMTESAVKEYFGSETLKKNLSALEKHRVSGGWELDGLLDTLGYVRYAIPSLSSEMIMKK